MSTLTELLHMIRVGNGHAMDPAKIDSLDTDKVPEKDEGGNTNVDG